MDSGRGAKGGGTLARQERTRWDRLPFDAKHGPLLR